MAKLLWGKVYFKDYYAGLLRQEAGGGYSFAYDADYLENNNPPIAHMLPLRSLPYVDQAGLHPFFDNLVAEGWLERAQTRLLNQRQATRFELLLAFGQDCAGAVSIIDPELVRVSKKLLDTTDDKEMSLLTSRASLSGVQPKLAITERAGRYYPTSANELSTHIAKFPSSGHPDLLHNEYLSTLALKKLLPDDAVVEAFMSQVEGQSEEALLIKRFDRRKIEADSTIERIHFEEFTQLLNYMSSTKYEGDYKEMSDFFKNTPGCLPIENYKLFGRILAGLLLGNTDMHLKNFAMIHTPVGLRLSPSYDEVASSLYKYKTIALGIGGTHNLDILRLKPKHIESLAKDFGFNESILNMMVLQLEKNKGTAQSAISDATVGASTLKKKIITAMDKRWNGTFALIGQNS